MSMRNQTHQISLFQRLSACCAALLFAAAVSASAETATFNFAQVGSSYSAFLSGDDPLVGKEIVSARIYLDVESFPGSDAANFYTDNSFPIEPFAGNTNAIVLVGLDLGWSGEGIFHYFEETTRFNGTFVAARYGGETPGENFDGTVLDSSRIEFDYIDDGGGDLALQSVASRKEHRVDNFDIDLPLSGSVGIEDRAGARTSTIVFTFNNNVVSVDGVTSTCGQAGDIKVDPADSHNVWVKLNSPLCDQTRVTLTLAGVTDDQGNRLDSAPVTLGILLGDVTGDGVVNKTDIAATRAVLGEKTNSSNFRADVNTDGIIDHNDVRKVASYRGHSLP
jgi:hypothetical protein